tara:strand:+ start:2126 stop:3583 length:1458 start_codon:yes stop_codon:yes gene_type:complete
MFDYLDKIFTSTKQIPELEGKVKAFPLDNVFSKEHYDKISSDVIKYKKFTKDGLKSIEGEEPSIITLEDIEEIDKFYKKLWEYFNDDKIKLMLLRKFGYNIDKVQADTLLRCMHQTISFHTEYPHQIDNSHTDQKYTLQTFTIQVYLPKDDSIKDYGTQFVDNNENAILHKQFLPNTGYMMASNNNAWHKPTMGVERKSLIIRYHIEIDYDKVKRVFNYNKDNDTCYIVWNKDMGVHPKITDWMATMTLINLIEHKFENIATTVEPFRNELLQLKRLKLQGFKKAVVFFGGYIWRTDEFKKYADTLDMKEIIAGMPFDDEFARQCFIINLDRLDELVEEDARDGFFSKYMKNDYIDISELIWSNRKYYHPEPKENGKINCFIRLDSVVKDIEENHDELYNRVKYMIPYRKNYTDLSPLVYSINNSPVRYCKNCKKEVLHLDILQSEAKEVHYNYICTSCSSYSAYNRKELNSLDYDESLFKDKED